ncbi:unnamed protein product [Peniophora sp. CBMAI 1063]|nr:unnamed protein product [Peniophora sp. CBMAI 1063]
MPPSRATRSIANSHTGSGAPPTEVGAQVSSTHADAQVSSTHAEAQAKSTRTLRARQASTPYADDHVKSKGKGGRRKVLSAGKRLQDKRYPNGVSKDSDWSATCRKFQDDYLEKVTVSENHAEVMSLRDHPMVVGQLNEGNSATAEIPWLTENASGLRPRFISVGSLILTPSATKEKFPEEMWAAVVIGISKNQATLLYLESLKCMKAVAENGVATNRKSLSSQIELLPSSDSHPNMVFVTNEVLGKVPLHHILVAPTEEEILSMWNISRNFGVQITGNKKTKRRSYAILGIQRTAIQRNGTPEV